MTDLQTAAKHPETDAPKGGTHGTTCLMHGMGDRLGVDVDRAARSGVIEAPELRQMITRCGQCTQHDACILWMVEHQNAQDSTPAYCLNTQELNYIRAVQTGKRSDCA